MNVDNVMLLISIALLVGSLGAAAWRIYRRHRTWSREFNAAARQVTRGVTQDNDAEFKAGMRRMSKLMSLPEEDE